jgi:hypothetical protein
MPVYFIFLKPQIFTFQQNYKLEEWAHDLLSEWVSEWEEKASDWMTVGDLTTSELMKLR